MASFARRERRPFPVPKPQHVFLLVAFGLVAWLLVISLNDFRVQPLSKGVSVSADQSDLIVQESTVPQGDANAAKVRKRLQPVFDPLEARSVVQKFDDWFHKDPLDGDIPIGVDDDSFQKDLKEEEEGDDLVEDGNGVDDDQANPDSEEEEEDSWLDSQGKHGNSEKNMAVEEQAKLGVVAVGRTKIG